MMYKRGHSAETRAKISAAQKGKKRGAHSAETGEKMNAAHKGKKRKKGKKGKKNTDSIP